MNTIYAAARLGLPLRLVKTVFELRAASAAGFAPALSHCASCGEELSALLLRKNEGDAFCLGCGVFGRRPGAGGGFGRETNLSGDRPFAEMPSGTVLFYVPPGALKALTHIISADLKKLFRFSASKSDMTALSELSESYLSAQLGCCPKTLSFYHKIAKNGAYI